MTEPSTEAPRLRAPTLDDPLEYNLSADAVLKILPFVCTDPHRPVLQALVIEPAGVIMATDGKTLGAFKGAVISENHPSERVCLYLPDADSRSMLARLAKGAKKKEPIFGVRVKAMTDGSAWTLTAGSEALLCPWQADYEKEYPNWRKSLLPDADAMNLRRATPTPEIGINPHLLSRFPGVTRLTFGGPSRTIFVTCPGEKSFWGLIAPWSLSECEDLPVIPDWVRS